MKDKQEKRLTELAPRDELDLIIREAVLSVERDLALEDEGWVNLSGTTGEVITASERISNIKLSRLYAIKDPLGKQSIRLWTDYTFGQGMTWNTEDKDVKEILSGFWDARVNRKILGAAGQRKSSDKVLIDGEIYFAIFLGKPISTIRRIDPLEITEIITDADDKEYEMYYRREWSDSQSSPHTAIYRSVSNIKDKPAKDSSSRPVRKTDEAIVYRLEYNDRNPLLLPALVWMKYHTKFLSSRIAVMLALAKFAWKTKVQGGQPVVDAIKAKTHDKEITAGSQLLENLGSDTTPIKTETGAAGAYQDGRMIKLQVCAAVGVGEQYMGDVSVGSLATAQTVELPMMKMFQSYQKVWGDAYQDINEVILEYNGISPDKWYVDIDFPPIAPEDIVQAAQAMVQILTIMPELAASQDVKQAALMILGINNTQEVLDALGEDSTEESRGNTDVRMLKAIQQFKEALKRSKK